MKNDENIGHIVRHKRTITSSFLTCVCVCMCVCVCVCVCVYVCVYLLLSKRLLLTEQNNKSNAKDQICDVVLRKYSCVKNLCRHVIDNHSKDLITSNCAKECQLNRAEPREVRHNSLKFSQIQR